MLLYALPDDGLETSTQVAYEKIIIFVSERRKFLCNPGLLISSNLEISATIRTISLYDFTFTIHSS